LCVCVILSGKFDLARSNKSWTLILLFFFCYCQRSLTIALPKQDT